MAELLDFRVPTGKGTTLLVLGLETDESEHSLYEAFSAYGVLYSVRIRRNAPVARPGYHAFIKFFSARDACRAQDALNQQCLFQKSPLKVCICTRQRSFPEHVLALNSNKCQELANHYLGFNGWSSHIITLQNIPGSKEEEVGTSPRTQQLKYLCIQELIIPQHGIRTRGIGVAEPHVDTSQEFLVATYRAQKLAVQRALSDAFQKILFVVLETGKVAVEYTSTQEDLVDCLTEEELGGLIQVNNESLLIEFTSSCFDLASLVLECFASDNLVRVNGEKLFHLNLRTLDKWVTDLTSSHLSPEGEEEILSDFSMDGE